MKDLICVGQVKAAILSGTVKIYIKPGTLITAAAQDLAKEKGLHFVVKDESNLQNSSSDAAAFVQIEPQQENNKELILQLVRQVLQSQGLLAETPYDAAVEGKSGLKVVRGDSVRYHAFDATQRNVNVTCQEVIHPQKSRIRSGFLIVDHSDFKRTLMGYEETDIIMEGQLTIAINGSTYTARQGDVIFIPENADVLWSTAGYAKLFYNRYITGGK